MVHIVVIDSAPLTSDPNEQGFHPSHEDVKAVKERLNREGEGNDTIHLIGYGDILKKYPSHPDIAEYIKGYPDFVHISPLRLDEWLTDEKRPTEGPIVYLVRKRGDMTPYDVMDIVEDWDSTKNHYGTFDKPLELRSIVEGILAGEYTLSNFYTGEGVSKINDELKKIAADTALVVSHYIRKGFNRSNGKMTETNIPSWMLNIECQPMKGFIGYYGLYPSGDITPAMAMRDSETYRALLTRTMASVIANFAVSSNLIRRDSDWGNPDVYDLIRSRLLG